MPRLDTKIDFMVEVEQDSPFEDLELTYKVTIPNVWASKRKLLGRENIVLGAEHNLIQVNFIIRARADIDETMFVKHLGVVYNIVGYEELKESRDYMLIATVKKQVII